MSHHEKIIELVKLLGIGDLRALEEAVRNRRYKLEKEHECAFKAIME